MAQKKKALVESGLDLMVSKGDTCWVVGQIHADDDNWEVCGVFATEEEAIAVCDNEYQFVGPIVFGKLVPKKQVSWPRSYFPLDK